MGNRLEGIKRGTRETNKNFIVAVEARTAGPFGLDANGGGRGGGKGQKGCFQLMVLSQGQLCPVPGNVWRRSGRHTSGEGLLLMPCSRAEAEEAAKHPTVHRTVHHTMTRQKMSIC